MRVFSSRKKATTVALAGALLLGTAGGAYAYWTTTGSGTGDASTTAGEAGHLTFTQSAVNAMYPGDSQQGLTVTVTNTGTQKSYVTGVQAWITTDKTGCTGADFLLNGSSAATQANPVALKWTAAELAAGGGHADATGTVQFNNTAGNQDACKGAAVTINYVAN